MEEKVNVKIDHIPPQASNTLQQNMEGTQKSRFEAAVVVFSLYEWFGQKSHVQELMMGKIG